MPTTLINIKKPTNCEYIYIGRGSRWGNPYSHVPSTKAQYRVKSRQDAIDSFREWIMKGDGVYLLSALDEIRGKTLGCYCAPQKCHGDVLIELCDGLQLLQPTLF